MRWVAVVLCFVVACKKKEPEPEATPPATPSVGHSKTKITADESPSEDHTAEKPRAAAEAPANAGGERPDAQLYGGNGQPAYRDENGRVRGPGGPAYMGRGVDCTDKIDHCLRDGVWFAVGNVQAGKLYRATPVFELEGTWWTFREKEVDDWQTLFKTKVVESASELTAGSPVIWLIEANSSAKWLNSEHDALTSSRWEAGVIESVGSTSFKVMGWHLPVPNDTARVIVDRKSAP